jgi:hypothetical protein
MQHHLARVRRADPCNTILLGSEGADPRNTLLPDPVARTHARHALANVDIVYLSEVLVAVPTHTSDPYKMRVAKQTKAVSSHSDEDNADVV